MKKNIILKRWSSPIGELAVGDLRGQLSLCDWTCSRHHQRTLDHLCSRLDAEIEIGESPLILQTIREIEEYMAGERTYFSVSTIMAGTEFQVAVWDRLREIPYGSRISYQELARRVGNPKAVRAVANAVGANPISIIVPCHRVVGSDGTLTGYAGGIHAKRALLEIEAPHLFNYGAKKGAER